MKIKNISPDTILFNDPIFTPDAAETTAQAVAIKDSRIMAWDDVPISRHKSPKGLLNTTSGDVSMNEFHVDPTTHFDLAQPLDETTFAIFDVETTDLSPAYGHRICEVGCLRVRNGAELDRFESLVDPRRPISPGALRVNRITAEMLRDAPTFESRRSLAASDRGRCVGSPQCSL